MKIIITEEQLKLIRESENKFKRKIQKKLDETLSNLKEDVEVNPKDFTKSFSDNVEYVDEIKISRIDVLEEPELKFDIEVEVVIATEITEADVVEILTEIAWIIKRDSLIKLKLSLGELTIKNKRKDF